MALVEEMAVLYFDTTFVLKQSLSEGGNSKDDDSEETNGAKVPSPTEENEVCRALQNLYSDIIGLQKFQQ